MKVVSAKELFAKLYDMSQSAGDCIYLLQNAFVYNSSQALDECEAKAREIHRTEKTLTKEFVEEAKTESDVRPYVSVPGHIERIGDYLEDLIGCTRTKIKESILFSDRAISEMTFLFQRIQEVLKNTSDIILARNTIIREYVKESANEIARSASDFATMHEERLIEGLCTPKASPLFLDMLDAVKGIAWHAKEIAVKLTSSPPA